jgi:hypothetical protein
MSDPAVVEEVEKGGDGYSPLFLSLAKELLSPTMELTRRFFTDRDQSPDRARHLLHFVDIILRGVSQVFLLDQPFCGLLIWMGLGFTSWSLAGFCLLGCCCSTLTAMWLIHPTDREVMCDPVTAAGLYDDSPHTLGH